VAAIEESIMAGLKAASLATLALALSLAAGCSRHKKAADGTGGGYVSAEGQAQEGKISIKAPGLDLAISLPKELTGEAKTGRDSKVLYPNATLAGMAIAAGETGKGGDTDVEMRFRTGDPPDQVAAWYRDPARRDGFKLTGEARDKGDFVFTGVQRRDRHPFQVRLGAAGGGGTDGRLRVHHLD
jgi:hypothetical protein